MDFRDKKSKIYSSGVKIIRIVLLILTIFYFINRNNRVLSNRIFNIYGIIFSLNFILLGTKKIFAEKNKDGYMDYFLAGVLLVLISVSIIMCKI